MEKNAEEFSEAQKKYHQSRKEKIVPKGIPAEESFWLPDHSKIHEILGKTNPFDEFGAEWGVSDLMQFLFPRKYRETQHKFATQLLEFMIARGGELHYMELGDFVEKTGVSKATLYNKIVPRLIDVGMVERHRKKMDAEKGPYKLELSQSFHNYLFKMAKEWRRIVSTARNSKNQAGKS
jgi:predicted transcriptional regulator